MKRESEISWSQGGGDTTRNVESRAAERRRVARQRARERERARRVLEVEKQKDDEKAFEEMLVAQARARARRVNGG